MTCPAQTSKPRESYAVRRPGLPSNASHATCLSTLLVSFPPDLSLVRTRQAMPSTLVSALVATWPSAAGSTWASALGSSLASGLAWSSAWASG